MRTITFYSYKGGVGRSLLVANTAKYLSALGKSVFAADFDLEAPGLHYKFQLGAVSSESEAAPGLVDVLSSFIKTGTFPKSLKSYATSLDVPKEAGPIHVLRAGMAPEGAYWQALSRINWYDLFYGSEPVGAQFFLELQERIKREFEPDFLLIDARTGITDMGGVATTVLPDTVVCLGLSSVEHLEGLRAVMRGISRTTTTQGQSVRIVPVISRLLFRPDSSLEAQELDRIRTFLNEPTKADSSGLTLQDVIALHSEPLLDAKEQLLVGGSNSPYELPLLRDYLRLFAAIIPADAIRPHVGQLIQRAIGRLLDDPDGAQSDLEALTTYCADEEAYRALLKLYQVRKAALEKSLATAALMWQMRSSKGEPEQLILDVIKMSFTEPRATDVQKKFAEFAEDVWRASGMTDARIGVTIAGAYLPERRERATRLLSEYVERAETPSYQAIVRLLDLLRAGRLFSQAFAIVERFKAAADDAAFHVSWARLVTAQNDRVLVRRLLEDETFRREAVRAKEPVTLYRLLKTGELEEASSFLTDAIELAVSQGDLTHLRETAELCYEEGRFDEFEARVRGRVPPSMWSEVSDAALHRRRYRYAR